MTNNKEQYWKGWEKCCDWTEKDFVFELKESLKKNFEMYQYFSTADLIYTFMEMMHGSYRNVTVAIIERFVREFKDAPDLPAGIKLVDDIVDAIRHTQDGKIMTTALAKPPAPKGKRKIMDQTVTPKLLVTNVPHLSWNEKNSELWNAHVDWTVKGIWQTLFEELDRTKKIDELRAVKWTEPIQLEIVDRFFDELEFKENIASHYPSDFTPLVKDNYGVTHNLTWHQQVIGYYATRSGLLDIGDTGVGKTAAALTAVALNDTMRNLIICPKSLIANNQWRNFIRNMFKDAVIFEQKDALKKDFKLPRGKRVFYLLSYQTASRSSGRTVLRKLQDIDYLILDEGQRVKIRDEDKLSRCRARIENMLTKIRKIRKINVLMLTATPVVNTVHEAKSLLQLITGKKFKDVSNFNSVYNLVKMHVKLKEFSIRYEKVYPVDISSKDICCSANLQLAPHRRLLTDIGFLGMDQIALSEAKMAKIIEEINRTPANEKIILFTKYVTGMVDVMAEELEKNNISYTFFTGTRKEGLDEKHGAEFFNGKRVLIASSAVAEGIDKIQDHCNNIWLVGHPWTYTERQQLIGRIYRTGQKKSVNVITFIAEINGYQYDQNVKIDRINTKKSYHDTIVDGVYPEKLVGRNESWRDIINAIVSGEKVRSSRVVNAGLMRRQRTG